jgi:hypothetical protein
MHAQAIEGIKSSRYAGSKTSSQPLPHAVAHFSDAALFDKHAPNNTAKYSKGKIPSKSCYGVSSSADDRDDDNSGDKLCSALRISFDSIAQVLLLFMCACMSDRIFTVFCASEAA